MVGEERRGKKMDGCSLIALVSCINPLYVLAYHGVDKLVAPHLNVFLFSHMHGSQGLEKVVDHSLGFAEEEHHFIG
jgi:hypothetical protein